MPPMGSVEAEWLEKQCNRITRGTMPRWRAWALDTVSAGGKYGERLMQKWGRWPRPSWRRLPRFDPPVGT